MSWLIKDKRTRIISENPNWPLSRALEGIDWQRASASKTLALMAFSLIVAYDFEAVIEIGISGGFSTQMLSRALIASQYGNVKTKLLISNDVNQNACLAAKKITTDVPLAHKVVKGDSKDVDWKGELDGWKLGLSFIDGDHSEETVFIDLKNCAELTQDFGFILCHDFHPRANGGVIPAVKRFLWDEENRRGYRDKSFWWSHIRLPHNHISADYDSLILQKRPFESQKTI